MIRLKVGLPGAEISKLPAESVALNSQSYSPSSVVRHQADLAEAAPDRKDSVRIRARSARVGMAEPQERAGSVSLGPEKRQAQAGRVSAKLGTAASKFCSQTTRRGWLSRHVP